MKCSYNKRNPCNYVIDHDFSSLKSTVREFHIVDVLLGRQQHQIKKDKIPIFILVGGASCGKSKIAQYVANVIGTSLRPIVNYEPSDLLGLSNWARSGSNIMVFDDFTFVSSKKDEPTLMFQQLKSWASGIPVDIRVAQNNKKASDESNVRVDGIFISVNKIPKEASDIVNGMPEMIDRLEILPFSEHDSYKNNWYVPQFVDSVQISDRCLTSYVKEYMILRQIEPNWSLWYSKMKSGSIPASNDVQKMIYN